MVLDIQSNLQLQYMMKISENMNLLLNGGIDGSYDSSQQVHDESVRSSDTEFAYLTW